MKLWVNLALGPGDLGARARIPLDGRQYLLEVFRTKLAEVWTLSIFAADGTPLLAGRSLRHGEDTLAFSLDARLPGDAIGKLGAWDTSGLQRDPGPDDLRSDSDVRLVYITADDD